MNILAAPIVIATVALSSVEKPSQALTSPHPIQLSATDLSPEYSDPRHDLTVLSYNVRGLPWPITKGRKRALKAIGEALGAMRRNGQAPDVVLIQEGFEDIAELVKLSGYRYWAAGPQRGDRVGPDDTPDAGGFVRARYRTSGEGWGKLTSAGLHVLSNFPIMEVQTAPYAYCAGWDCLANKGVMMVHVEIPGLPNGIDLATTHMNSLDTAKVPTARSLQAHHLQLDAMMRFVGRHRSLGAPLVVGGDFNIRGAPDRYYYKVDQRPFTVVSEYCMRADSGCADALQDGGPEPWLESEDLQAFADAGPVALRPREARTIFNGLPGDGARLSDHDGYLVRYVFTPARPAGQMTASAQ